MAELYPWLLAVVAMPVALAVGVFVTGRLASYRPA